VRKKLAVSEPAELDLVAKQGATFDLQVTWGDGTVNLTGKDAQLTVRRGSVPTSAVILDATPANGRITLGTNGLIHVVVSNTLMAGIEARVFNYDLVLKMPAVEPVLEGLFIVKPTAVHA